MSESFDNIVDMAHYRAASTELDPNTLTDSEFVDLVLTMGVHPSVANNPQGLARHLLAVLPGNHDEGEGDWIERARQISVQAAELDDAQYDKILQDDVICYAIELIRAKNGHTRGNEQVLEAARALINLRAGIVLEHTDMKEYSLDRWAVVIRRLGKTAVSSE